MGGNKWRKLKYNLIEAKNQGKDALLTFGGAYSNHIYATAAAGKHFDFKTIGIIRGDELNPNSSPTLQFAQSCSMELHFISREAYRKKQIPDYINLSKVYQVPEGGTNPFALRGVAEMVAEIKEQLGFNPAYIVCPVGTGGTLAGIVSEVKTSTNVIGICVLKNGNYLFDEIKNLLIHHGTWGQENFEIFWNFHHGGYAKISPELLNFIKIFEQEHQIKLDTIYTGKMLFALYDLIKNFHFPKNTTIVAIHTGLQGNTLRSAQ